MPDASIERWKKYLLYDPTRWLLETNDPSILLWYQLDIAHRPEDAPGVIETRQRVLYSDPVQQIFAAQNELGYWGDPDNLVEPRFTATLWNLLLLSELGIPRASRRARNACEFILQNFLNGDGTWNGLELPEMGYTVRALSYFIKDDPRVYRAATLLQQRWRDILHDNGTSPCLWAWSEYRDDPDFQTTIHDASEEVLEDCAMGYYSGTLAFPHFYPWDTLFTLRVLAAHDRINDPRTEAHVNWLAGFGDTKGRFPLPESLNEQLVTPLESMTTESRWITLNALRVITKLVLSEKKED